MHTFTAPPPECGTKYAAKTVPFGRTATEPGPPAACAVSVNGLSSGCGEPFVVTVADAVPPTSESAVTTEAARTAA
jgi:hypothetical protein